MQQTNPQADNSAVIKLFAIGFCSVLLIKVFLALVLDLYSDEVFYWQASARPALAYSDLPFMTALLIGIGSSLNPGSAIAAQTEFSGLATAGFTLDQDKAVRDGRISQYQLWRLDASGLADEAGKSALFITEDSTLTILAKHDVLGRVCELAIEILNQQGITLRYGDRIVTVSN